MRNMREKERKGAIDYYALSSHRRGGRSGSGLYFPVKAEGGTAGRLLLLLLCSSSSSSFSSFEYRGGGKALKWEVVGERLVPESRTEPVSLSLAPGQLLEGGEDPPLAAAAVGAREVGVGGWRRWRSWRRSEAGTEMGKKE